MCLFVKNYSKLIEFSLFLQGQLTTPYKKVILIQ